MTLARRSGRASSPLSLSPLFPARGATRLRPASPDLLPPPSPLPPNVRGGAKRRRERRRASEPEAKLPVSHQRSAVQGAAPSTGTAAVELGAATRRGCPRGAGERKTPGEGWPGGFRWRCVGEGDESHALGPISAWVPSGSWVPSWVPGSVLGPRLRPPDWSWIGSGPDLQEAVQGSGGPRRPSPPPAGGDRPWASW